MFHAQDLTTCTALALAFALTACGGDATASVDGVPSAAPTSSAAPSAPSATSATSDATSTAPAAAADGAVTRMACTSKFGSAITSAHGRLDGELVSIVPAGSHACNGDSQHLHLQVRVGGSVYDVAANIDGLETEVDAPLPGAPWSEGWHGGESLDYVKDLGLHAPAFTVTGLATVRADVEAALARASHVAIYATGYGPAGVHLVHREGGGRDGAIVLDPLGSPHVIAFRFDTQSF